MTKRKIFWNGCQRVNAEVRLPPESNSGFTSRGFHFSSSNSCSATIHLPHSPHIEADLIQKHKGPSVPCL